MQPHRPRGLFLILFLGLGLLGLQAAMQQVPSHRPAALAGLTPLGRLDVTKKVSFAISLPLRNQAALTKFLAEVSDPKSANYRHYLTPAQFAEKFGPTVADYDAVVNFAKANGLTVKTLYPNRTLVDVEGPVPAVEKALHVTMFDYQHPTEKRHFFAPSAEPKLDISVPVLGISGLNNYALPQPRLRPVGKVQASPLTGARLGTRTKSKTSAAPNFGSGPGQGYWGTDFRNAYAPGVTLTGSGQVVGLLQFDGYTPADIATYAANAGVPAVPLVNILLDGYDGTPTFGGGEVEVSLDIEMAMSMAPGLSAILLYEAGPNGDWHDLLNRMANDNYAKQLSCSWYIPGGVKDPGADQIFQQMIAQGQSFYSASGDSDAFNGLIPFPGDTPYITEVGGTFLTTQSAGGSYQQETAWNRGNGIGTGGGISTQYTLPSWQSGINMALNEGSLTMRNVPDVAMTAENVYVRADGEDLLEGGTSCAAPLWAGFTALVNQQAANNSVRQVGFINSAIYAIGLGQHYNSDFNDPHTGDNESANSPLKFPCVTGYDLCTGWGSPSGLGLINDLIAGSGPITPPGPPINPTITTSGALASGTKGAPYYLLLSSTGGTPPCTWSVSSGNFPPGLTLSSYGVISGTPNVGGTFNFNITLTGTDTGSATAACSIIISPFSALDHFAWAAIPTPQSLSAPFPVTVTAQDFYNNTVTSFQSTAVFTAGAPLALLNSPVPQFNGNGGTFTVGYSFTPKVSMNVSAARTYFGTKLSIWTDSGTLVSSTPVSGTARQWTETSLNPPVVLRAGTTYRLGVLTGGQNYYWRTDMASAYPGGTIGQMWYNTGDAFPALTQAGFQWFLVDLRYTLGPTLTPSPITAGPFTSGVLSTSVTMTQGGNGVALLASNGGHTGVSNIFDVQTAANLVVSPTSVFSSAGSSGGPFTPVSATFTVGNSGTGSMNWSASNADSWLTVSPSSGTLSPGAKASVTATITANANSLPVKSYVEPINFTNTTNGVGNITRYASLTVNAFPPVITSAAIATGAINQSFSFQVTATNNPTSFSVPSTVFSSIGLTIDSVSGIISGTPNVSGSFDFTIQATNSGGTGTQDWTLNIAGPPNFADGPPFATILVNQPYAFNMAAFGYPVPTLSVTSGSLPPGLTLAGDGKISGTPTKVGIFTGAITATNGFPPDSTQNFSLTVQNTFAGWEAYYFDAQQLADPTIFGLNANPAHDGVPNLLKYAFDMSPRVNIGASDRAALPAVSLMSLNGATYLTLTYRQNPLAGGITVNVQTSPDLQTWTTVLPDIVQTAGTDTATSDPMVQVGVLEAPLPQREYIRLNVTVP